MFSKELRKLQSKSKALLKKNKKIIFDIVLFGSIVRGKYKPEDVDVAVIFKEKIPRTKIDSIVSQLKNFHTEYIFLDEIYSEPVWQTLISEGFSLTKNKFLHEILGMKSWFLFTYNLDNLIPTEKPKFFNAVFGRTKGTGLLKELGGRSLGRGAIIVPLENVDKMREILDRWKVNYNVKKIFIL